MVSLVNKFAAKVEDKKGALSEDEVSALLLNTYCTLHIHFCTCT